MLYDLLDLALEFLEVEPGLVLDALSEHRADLLDVVQEVLEKLEGGRCLRHLAPEAPGHRHSSSRACWSRQAPSDEPEVVCDDEGIDSAILGQVRDSLPAGESCTSSLPYESHYFTSSSAALLANE